MNHSDASLVYALSEQLLIQRESLRKILEEAEMCLYSSHSEIEHDDTSDTDSHEHIDFKNGNQIFRDMPSIYIDALFYAIEQGNFETVKWLVSTGVDLCLQEKSYLFYATTPLLKAAEFGSIKIIQHLIENGADIYQTNNDLDTPLCLAIKNRHAQATEFLLNIGSDLNATNIYHQTPILLAIQQGSLSILRSVLTHSTEYRIHAKNDNNETILMLAIQRKSKKMVRWILHAAPTLDVNAKSKNEETALMMAVKTKSTPIVKILLRQRPDIDVNARSKNHHTALMMAAEMKLSNIIKVLLKNHKIQINAQNIDGNSAILIALYSQSHLSMRILLQKGADIHLKNNLGESALMLASVWNHNMSKTKHPNIDSQNNSTEETWMIESQKKNKKTLLLLSAGPEHQKIKKHKTAASSYHINPINSQETHGLHLLFSTNYFEQPYPYPKIYNNLIHR